MEGLRGTRNTHEILGEGREGREGRGGEVCYPHEGKGERERESTTVKAGGKKWVRPLLNFMELGERRGGKRKELSACSPHEEGERGLDGLHHCKRLSLFVVCCLALACSSGVNFRQSLPPAFYCGGDQLDLSLSLPCSLSPSSCGEQADSSFLFPSPVP